MINITDAQIEKIKVEANKELYKKYRMLGNDTIKDFHIIYVFKAYNKIIKEKK
jgi:hypothetical protein